MYYLYEIKNTVAAALLRPFLLAKLYVESVVSAVRWIIVTLFTYLRIRRFAAKFPAGGNAWPLIGDMHVAFGMDEPDIVRYVIDYVKGLPCGVVWLSILPIFYVCDPQDVERVLRNPKSQGKPDLHRFLEAHLGKGLVTASGETWQRHIKIISTTFHTKILDSFVPAFNRQTDIFIDILRRYADGITFDILPAAESLALDIICETAMGIDMKMQSGSAHEYLNALVTLERCVLERTMRPWLFFDCLYAMTSIRRREKTAQLIANGVRDRVIRERKKILAAGGDLTTTEDGRKRRPAFLDHLLLSVKEGALLTDNEIADEVATFMAAGSDTTSILIPYALFEMARHPNVQDKVLEELESLYDSSQPTIDISPEDLSRMTYLEMVLKETLRLHPPVPLIVRSAGEDIRLATRNLVIPANAIVAIGIYLTHRSSEFCPDPYKFNPERFCSRTSKDRRAFSFIPFGGGQRICIGRRFAILEAKVVIAKALWQYTFSPDPEYQPADKWGITLKPANGLRLKMRKRKLKI